MDMTQEQVDLLRAKENHSTKQIMAMETKIRRAAITQVRRFFYGPTLKPRLRDQALHFCSFGTLVKVEALKRVYPWD